MMGGQHSWSKLWLWVDGGAKQARYVSRLWLTRQSLVSLCVGVSTGLNVRSRDGRASAVLQPESAL